MSRRAFLAAVGLFSVLSVVLWLATGVGYALADSTSFSESNVGTRPGQVQQNRPPRFTDFGNNRSVAENTPAGQNIGAAVVATDADGDTLTYSLGGTDAASFDIVATSGQLQTNAALDYETKNSYTVTVTVTDLSSASDTITVNIQVADVDEDGEITFSPVQPEAYTGLVATLADDDTVVSIQSWQWEISGNSTWTTIAGATTGTYVPLDSNVGKYLRVTVTYTDGHGPGKTATATTTHMVAEEEEDDDEHEGPVFSTDTAQRSIAENAAANTNIGSPVTASGPAAGENLTYTLRGTDAASFAIVATSGQLQTKAALDYETRSSYTVTVTVTDQLGGFDTITVNIAVTNVDPPGKPGTPTVAAASVGGHNTLSVTWAAPANAGTAISGYNAQYRAGTGGAWSGIARSVSGTAATVSGLTPGTTYQVQVRAYNSEGAGPWSDPGQGSTAARQQGEVLGGSGGGTQSTACAPGIGFRTGIPFTFTAAKGGEDPPVLLMEVWNRELCGMDFKVSSGAKWLSFSPASGRSEGAHQQRLIRVSADISGLGVGTHTAAIRITAPGSSNSPQTVSVSLAITEPVPLKPDNCQERTVIESSDGTLRVVVPPNSAPCDTGITVESLDADSRKTPEGKSVEVVRLGEVSAASADSRIDAALWALLPGDRVSGCAEAAAAMYRVDGDSWDLLTFRCESDTQGHIWAVSPLTSFGVYAVTLLVPSAEAVIIDRGPGPEAGDGGTNGILDSQGPEDSQGPGAGAAGTNGTLDSQGPGDSQGPEAGDGGTSGTLDSQVPCRILVAPEPPSPEAETCQWVTVPGQAPAEERTSCQQLIVPGGSSPEAETCQRLIVPGQAPTEERTSCQQLTVAGGSSPEAETCRWMVVPGQTPAEERTSCRQLIIPGRSRPETGANTSECVITLTDPATRPEAAAVPDGGPGVAASAESAPPVSSPEAPAEGGTGMTLPGPVSLPLPGDLASWMPWYAAAGVMAVLTLLITILLGTHLRRRLARTAGQ